MFKFILSENFGFDVDSNHGRAIAGRMPYHSATEAWGVGSDSQSGRQGGFPGGDPVFVSAFSEWEHVACVVNSYT